MKCDDDGHYLRKVPFYRFLNFSVMDRDAISTTGTMPFADQLIGNPVLELYHGGIIASFMEALAAISVDDGPPASPPKPINLTVDYLRPAIRGDLIAKATVVRKGKRMASVRTVAWQIDPSRPAAAGLYHFLLV